MLETGAAIYDGTLRHRRSRPKAHQFRYSLFMAFLDIDRLPDLMRVSPLASYNRWNWASYQERDHLGDPRVSLRRRLESDAAARGVALPSGRIFLLTHLRYLGYCFNPVSFYYALDGSGPLRPILAEVHNTFGERHPYWLADAGTGSENGMHRFRCRKELHVSPFMDMHLEYRFAFSSPGKTLSVHMETLQNDVHLFDATLSLRRRPWDRGTLHRVLAVHPWMTAKVTAAIHWQALKLYWKGLPVFTHPDRDRGAAILAAKTDGGEDPPHHVTGGQDARPT